MTEDRERTLVGRDRALLAEGYRELLGDLKERIRSAQVTAALSVNRELIALYWQIGRAIGERQETHGWGDAGDRPPLRRSAPCVPRHEGVFTAQPPLHAHVRRGVSGAGLLAASCCQFALRARHHGDGAPRDSGDVGRPTRLHDAGNGAHPADVLGLDFLETADGSYILLESNDTPGLAGFPEEARLAVASLVRDKIDARFSRARLTTRA